MCIRVECSHIELSGLEMFPYFYLISIKSFCKSVPAQNVKYAHFLLWGSLNVPISSNRKLNWIYRSVYFCCVTSVPEHRSLSILNMQLPNTWPRTLFAHGPSVSHYGVLWVCVCVWLKFAFCSTTPNCSVSIPSSQNDHRLRLAFFSLSVGQEIDCGKFLAFICSRPSWCIVYWTQSTRDIMFGAFIFSRMTIDLLWCPDCVPDITEGAHLSMDVVS